MSKRFVRALFVIYSVLIAMPSICFSVADTQQKSGLVYGDGYSFWIDAPKGWVLDPKTAKEYGLNIVLFQDGFSFRNAPAVMYTSKLRRTESVEDAMKHEASMYNEKYKGILISRRPPVKTKDNKTALIQYYKGGKQDQTDEAVAFIQENGLIVLLVLSAKSEKTFEEAYPAFEQLIKSYALSNVTVMDNGEARISDFAARVKVGKQTLASPEGQQYEASWGESMQTILTTCIPIGSTNPANLGRFTFVADVSASGVISSVEVQPSNTVSRCFAQHFGKARLPRPPMPLNASGLLPIADDIVITP